MIEGIAIATRPDCLNDQVFDLLEEINNDYFLWVELGLQTMHDDTALFINRCYPTSVYEEAIAELNKRNIRVVTHLILGLPGETRDMMRESVKYVCAQGTWGLKLHLLNVVRGSQMEMTHSDYNSFESLEEYVEFVCDLVEIIPEDVVIHRLTGDAPRKVLMTPAWSYRKRSILNGIQQELHLRGSRQGCKAEK